MRSFLLFFASLVLCCIAHAQVPSSFNYQSVVRDGFNVLIANQPIGVQASIVQDSVGGASLYSETHSVSTNANGLFSIQIGMGTAVSGSFNSIDWTTADLHYQIEIDLQGGSNYTLSSFHSFTTVPYAMVAERAIMADDADADSTNELQSLSAVLEMGSSAGQESILNLGSISIGTSIVDSSAIMDIASSSKGILIPRMSKIERDSIVNPSEGLLLYQSNGSVGFYYFTNGQWIQLQNAIQGDAIKKTQSLIYTTNGF